VSVFAGTALQPYDRQTDGADNFGYYDLFENMNSVFFTTVNPVDVHSIWVKTEKDHRAGTPVIGPFDMVAGVFGDNITSVHVTSPAGITEALEPAAGAWYWDMEEKYATLEDLRQDFPVGFYEFMFNQGETTEDSVMVWIDPEQPTGFANITYPTDGATDVPVIPTFTWDSCLGYGDSLWVGVGDIEADTDLYRDGLNIGQTSWTCGPLVLGRLCGFTVHVVIESPIQLLTTEKGDPLTCSDVFSWSNEVRFTILGLVMVDIKPGSYPNSLNVDGHGVIPVAILGSAEFDVTDIDASSLSFGGLAVRVKRQGRLQCSVEDVSGDFNGGPEGAPDGYPDLVCHFVDNPDNWSPGDGEATITGTLIDGTPFAGSDEITVVPPQ
jgi:hypothetical protein